jgi:hypothetical protein
LRAGREREADGAKVRRGGEREVECWRGDRERGRAGERRGGERVGGRGRGQMEGGRGVI